MRCGEKNVPYECGCGNIPFGTSPGTFRVNNGRGTADPFRLTIRFSKPREACMKRWAHSSLMGGVGVGLNFLREKDCEKIHEASLEVLHDRGAYFDSETAREVLRDHGCWEDADGCTHFPRTLVESALEAVPAEFVHRGRTPDDDIHMAQDQVYASNFGEGIFTHDLETGERRSTVKQDAVDILRVVDSLDNIHIYNRAIGPQDVPSESASMHNAEVAFCYTSKPMHLVSGSPFQTKKMIKMAEIAAGGKEELKKRPRTAFIWS